MFLILIASSFAKKCVSNCGVCSSSSCKVVYYAEFYMYCKSYFDVNLGV